MDGERLHALDALRAWAMFLGIVLHAAASFIVSPFPWIVRDVSRSPWFDLLLVVIHGFRMQLFFFLAGFFAHLLYQRMGARVFAEQRFRRIAIPFLVGLVILLPVLGGVLHWSELFLGAPSPIRGFQKASARAFPTAHLWFLEMLVVLYALALAAAWLWGQRSLASLSGKADAAFDRVMGSPWKVVLLALPTAILLANGPEYGEIDHMGRSILFSLESIAYYGLYFAVGWWLHRRPANLAHLQDWNRTYFAVAAVAMAVLLAGHATTLEPRKWQREHIAPVANFAAAVYAWTMTFALAGLFLKAFGADRPWKRYLADASYWCYLLHLPVVMVLQVLVARLPVNGWLKLGFIIALSVGALLLSYRYLVRYTWLGTALNGPRSPALPRATLG